MQWLQPTHFSLVNILLEYVTPTSTHFHSKNFVNFVNKDNIPHSTINNAGVDITPTLFIQAECQYIRILKLLAVIFFPIGGIDRERRDNASILNLLYG
jgi:hypothetical protein